MGIKERLNVFMSKITGDKKASGGKSVQLASESITSRDSTTGRKRLEELEELYRMDGLVFGIINRYVRDIVGPGYAVLTKDENIREITEAFTKNRKTGFNKMLRFAIRDGFIYGFGIFEITYDNDKNPSKIDRILRIDPKTIEFKKKGGKVIRDKYGYPEGFVYRDEKGKEVALPNEKVAFFTFHPLHEGDVGISPLEVLYRPLLFKLNIEESFSESLWRTGYPPIVAKVGDDKHYPTEKEIEGLAKDIKQLKSRNAFILPYWTDIGPLDIGRPADIETYLDYYGTLVRECLGAPEEDEVAYEKTIIALQKELSEQVEEQVFRKLAVIHEFDEVPRLQFGEHSAEMRLSKARRLGVYARSGLLSWDEDIEKAIRIEESLPCWSGSLTPEEKEERKDIIKRQRRIRLSDKEKDELFGE